jgi:hypothetical protein
MSEGRLRGSEGGAGVDVTHVAEELIDDVLELRRADVLRQVERRPEVLPLRADQLAHDAAGRLAGRRRSPVVVHLCVVAWRRRLRQLWRKTRREGCGVCSGRVLLGREGYTVLAQEEAQ